LDGQETTAGGADESFKQNPPTTALNDAASSDINQLASIDNSGTHQQAKSQDATMPHKLMPESQGLKIEESNVPLSEAAEQPK